jgi:diguanylate cyclase (GGDEF)-like protein
MSSASGDTVLLRVAEALRATLRTTDLAVRYGGDEFAVVLPQTGKTEAFAVAEKLRLRREGAGHVARATTTEASDVGVRVSVGVAAATGAASSPQDLLEAADRALYRAKQNGRNQVRLAPG